MTHPIFRKEIFIETAFERRFQAMLRSAWHNKCQALTSDGHAGPVGGNHVVPKPALLGISRIIRRSYP